MQTLICKECGKQFKGKTTRNIFCPNCRKLRNAERSKQSSERLKKETHEIKHKKAEPRKKIEIVENGIKRIKWIKNIIN